MLWACPACALVRRSAPMHLGRLSPARRGLLPHTLCLGVPWAGIPWTLDLRWLSAVFYPLGARRLRPRRAGDDAEPNLFVDEPLLELVLSCDCLCLRFLLAPPLIIESLLQGPSVGRIASLQGVLRHRVLRCSGGYRPGGGRRPALCVGGTVQSSLQGPSVGRVASLLGVLMHLALRCRAAIGPEEADATPGV
jgi:hypothetical protein